MWGELYARQSRVATRVHRRSGFTPDTFIGGNPGRREVRATSEGSRALCAFTLFELLTVIAIIALAAALALGGGRYAVENGKCLRAQTELAALSGALESYKREFGDYPQTANSAELMQALIGRRAPTGVSVVVRCRLELDRFRTKENRDPFSDSSTELIDPWDQSYVYAYKTNAGWTNPSYVLFSSGKDGQFAPLSVSGTVDPAATENLDNVYATP